MTELNKVSFHDSNNSSIVLKYAGKNHSEMPCLESTVVQSVLQDAVIIHCLHPLLPPDKTLNRMLRARGQFQLPTYVYNLHKKSFVTSKFSA